MVVFLFQIGQFDFLRIAVGLFHVIDIELLKIAGDNPAWMLGERELCNVLLGLLKGLSMEPSDCRIGLFRSFPLPFCSIMTFVSAIYPSIKPVELSSFT